MLEGFPAVVRDDDTLAGGEAVVLDHVGGTQGVQRLLDLLDVVQTWARPVGTSAADMTSLANALLPSRPRRLGRRAEARDAGRATASATPATSGASGPTTTRSTAEPRRQRHHTLDVGEPARERLARGQVLRCPGCPGPRRPGRPTGRGERSGRWRAHGPRTRRRGPSRPQSRGGRGLGGARRIRHPNPAGGRRAGPSGVNWEVPYLRRPTQENPVP